MSDHFKKKKICESPVNFNANFEISRYQDSESIGLASRSGFLQQMLGGSGLNKNDFCDFNEQIEKLKGSPEPTLNRHHNGFS